MIPFESKQWNIRGMFAFLQISPVCLWRYVGASALGLFPTQLISVYLGTTVRSMEEVLVDENTAHVGYGVLILQVSHLSLKPREKVLMMLKIFLIQDYFERL